MQALWIGVWGTLPAAVAIGLYAALTWEQPNRDVLVGACVATVVGSLMLRWPIPAARLVVGPRRDWFNFLWTCTLVVAIAIVAVADGGVGSPVLLALLVTQTYAALAYPLRVVVAATTVEVLAGIAVVLLSPPDVRPQGIVLVVALLSAAGIAGLMAQTERARRRALRDLAQLDPLTGVLNRRGFERHEAVAVTAAVDGGPPVVLIMVDLDGFKRVNDTHGHLAGDELLRWVAAALRHAVGPEAPVGRIGGDEFAVIVDPRAPGASADAIRAALAPRTACSVGVARAPEDALTRAGLVRVADQRLYEDKRTRAATAVVLP